jgi:uncharacterized protein (DUF1499 family)
MALFIVGPLLAWLRIVTALTGFALFALGGLLAIIASVGAIVALVRGRGIGVGRILALVATVIFFVGAAGGSGSPRINDFTSDLDDPPAFAKAGSDPANAGRDMGYPASFAEQQRACCGDLRPARLAVAPDVAFARAEQVAESLPDWTVVDADPATGRIEAVSTSRIFGFKDDVVIRVRPDGSGSRIDIRSKSRDGQGDMGVNANRIRTYVTAVEAGT